MLVAHAAGFLAPLQQLYLVDTDADQPWEQRDRGLPARVIDEQTSYPSCGRSFTYR